MTARGRRRITAKQRLADAFGGGCQRCGYRRCLRALQFHHSDSSQKQQWSRGSGRADFAEVEAHPERFALLCANCHFEEHEANDPTKAVVVFCQKCGNAIESEECRLKIGRDRFCSARCHHDHRIQSAGLNLRPRLEKYISNEGECRRWTGFMTNGTTPTLTTKNPDGTYSPKSAARLMYEIETGANPPGKLYRKCPTLGCVNPQHQRVVTC